MANGNDIAQAWPMGVPPTYGIQFPKVGQGGPSGDVHVRATTPVPQVPLSGWLRTIGYGLFAYGQARIRNLPTVVDRSGFPAPPVIVGLTRQPGTGMVNS